MTSIMRRTVRGTAAGLGALAIVAGTAACGGLIDEVTGGDGGDDPTVEEQDPADEGTDEDAEGADTESDDSGATEDGTDTEDADDAADDAGDAEDSDESEDTADDAGDSASGDALSEDDLSAVADRYYEFLQATVEGDGKAGCGLLMNPYTDAPLEGSALEACAEGFSSTAEEEGMDESLLDIIDPSMIEGVDNGDGTAGVTMMGQDGRVVFVKGEDGKWYIDGSDFV
ncbi:hypothetical protein [Brachybacterium massiliense]|uniref:hypothetical protein n=1 Tax=Brachybacterium massiliense TaxID=1755098 RepID=UPI000B3BCD06|nr:hypothetical protein [Brachybacterium massiliense]